MKEPCCKNTKICRSSSFIGQKYLYSRKIRFLTFKIPHSTVLIIGIAGGTGSGKTTVVRKIVESLPDGAVAVIPQDSYYNDQSDLPLEVRKQTNFDHPDAFE